MAKFEGTVDDIQDVRKMLKELTEKAEDYQYPNVKVTKDIAETARQNAVKDANNYTNEKIAEIPQPTVDYTDLTNKPSINNVELSGNKTNKDLSIPNIYVGETAPQGTDIHINPNGETILIPEKTSELENDSDFATNKSVDEKIANIPSEDSLISRDIIVPDDFIIDRTSPQGDVLYISENIKAWDSNGNPILKGFPKIEKINEDFGKFDKILDTKLLYSSQDFGKIDAITFAKVIGATSCIPYILIFPKSLSLCVDCYFSTEELALQAYDFLDNGLIDGTLQVVVRFQEIKEQITAEAVQ